MTIDRHFRTKRFQVDSEVLSRFIVGLLLRRNTLTLGVVIAAIVSLAFVDVRYTLALIVLGAGFLPMAWIMMIYSLTKHKENRRNLVPMTIDFQPGSHITITRFLQQEDGGEEEKEVAEIVETETLHDKRLKAVTSGRNIVIYGTNLVLLMPADAIIHLE